MRLGEIALKSSDYDDACTRVNEALHLYRSIEDVLGKANCSQLLGDIALERSEPETAGTFLAEALGLYQRIQAPYSIGWIHYSLARLAPAGSEERQSHLKAAQEAWENIKRPDLVEWLREEFGEDAGS